MRVLMCAAGFFCMLAAVASLGLSQDTPGPTASTTQTEVSADSQNGTGMEAPALRVVFQSGQLSISGRSCTLKQILDAVREETGASLDIPAVLSIPIIAVQLGPDDPQRVLGSLFSGTGLNYIVVGSVERGDKLNIIVALRSEPSISPAPPPPAPAKPPEEVVAEAESVSGDPGSGDANVADDKHEEKPGTDGKTKDEEEIAADKPEHPSAEEKVAVDAATNDVKSSLENSPAVSANDRLADLPQNINPAIAALYPSLFSGGAANTSGAASGVAAVAAGTPIITQAPPSPRTTYNPGVTIPVDATGIPILPSNIPPQMWGLYPPNLMQLINSNTAPPVIPVTPLAPGLPATTTTGQTVFWDQALQGHQ